MAPQLPTPPATVAEFKKWFARDFKYGEGPDTVRDEDIARAMAEAMTKFNARLFSVADGWVAFLNLAAHFVRVNIEAAGGLSAEHEGLGIQNQGEQLLAGAGVQGVNKNFVEPPEWVKRIPLFQQLWITTYGQAYATMAQPMIVGAMSAICGPTPPGGLPMPDVPFTDQ